MSYTCKNIESLSREEWQEYCDYLRALLPENQKPADGERLKAERDTLKARHPLFIEHIIYRDGAIAGRIGFTAPDKDRPKDINIDLSLETRELDEGLYVLFLRLLREFLEEYKYKDVSFLVKNDVMKAAVEKAGMKVLKKLNYYELAREDIDLQMLEEWRDKGAKQNAGLKLRFFSSIPDELMDEYCALFSELLNQMPCENEKQEPYIISPGAHKIKLEQLAAQGFKLYMYMLFNERNELVGNSNVLIKEQEGYCYQFMTGVRADYRGRALGKWMKAAMYIKLLNDFPSLKKIESDANAVNNYIQDINSRIGFKMVKTGWVFEADKESPGAE